jgi:hypothetical protein
MQVSTADWSPRAVRNCQLVSANASAFETLFGAPVSYAEGFWRAT